MSIQVTNKMEMSVSIKIILAIRTLSSQARPRRVSIPGKANSRR